jgi:gamma-glutamyltranspeptidase
MKVPLQPEVRRRRLIAGIVIGIAVGSAHALVSHASNKASAEPASAQRPAGGAPAAAEEDPEGRSQARSMVISPRGVVATEHPYGSQAGAMILAAGGSAIDAAIAANAMTGLVAPHMNGIGGDLFAIVYEASSGKLYGINASGWAGSGDRRTSSTFLILRSTDQSAGPRSVQLNFRYGF